MSQRFIKCIHVPGCIYFHGTPIEMLRMKTMNWIETECEWKTQMWRLSNKICKHNLAVFSYSFLYDFPLRLVRNLNVYPNMLIAIKKNTHTTQKWEDHYRYKFCTLLVYCFIFVQIFRFVDVLPNKENPQVIWTLETNIFGQMVLGERNRCGAGGKCIRDTSTIMPNTLHLYIAIHEHWIDVVVEF